MQTIDQVCDQARQRAGITSDRKLSLAVSDNQNLVNFWRTKRANPSDDNFLAIAALAGIGDGEALLLLNYWRAKGHARDVYKALLESLKGAAAVLVFLIAVTAGDDVNAKGTEHHASAKNIHYAVYGCV